LLDSGKWDNYFALFARNAAVPWKRITIRSTRIAARRSILPPTTSIDDVLCRRELTAARDGHSHLKPVAHWRSPAPGQTFA